MKKHILLIVTILLTVNAFAYDFDAWCDTGQKLYYNITGANTVDVVGCWNPEGELCIPEEVVHDGMTYFVTRIGDEAFSECHGFYGTLTIPETVYWIGYHSFYKCDGFTGDLVIPNSVQYIDGAAFLGCTGFTTLTIGEGLVDVNAYAFASCFSLKKMYFNAIYCQNFGYHTDDFVTVRIPAFDHLDNLKEIVIGDRVQHIEPYAFEECGEGGLSSLTIGRDVTEIGEYAFMDTRLDTLTFNATNYYVAEDDEWWIQYTDDVKVLTIGNDVTTVHKEFEDLIYLRKITFGKSVTVIESGAFGEYVRPDTICMKGEIPPEIKENALQYFPKNAKVFVPCDALSNYQNAPGWNEFTNYETYFSFNLTVKTNNASIGIAEIIKEADCTDNQAIVKATAVSNGAFEYWEKDGNIVSYDETFSFELDDDISLMAVFSYPTDIEEVDCEELAVYPNPTTGAVFVDLNDIESVEVFNISGQVEICGISISENHSVVTIGNSGIYFLKIKKNSGEYLIKKMIVK